MLLRGAKQQAAVTLKVHDGTAGGRRCFLVVDVDR